MEKKKQVNWGEGERVPPRSGIFLPRGGRGKKKKRSTTMMRDRKVNRGRKSCRGRSTGVGVPHVKLQIDEGAMTGTISTFLP